MNVIGSFNESTGQYTGLLGEVAYGVSIIELFLELTNLEIESRYWFHSIPIPDRREW